MPSSDLPGLTLRIDAVFASPPAWVEPRLEGLEPFRSSILKRPVSGRIAVGPLGLEGDGQADARVHGGRDQAVCVYPAEHYSLWAPDPELGLEPGGFGENLSVAGGSEADVCIGDVFEGPGDGPRFQVTQARVPCWKLSALWGRKDFHREVRASRQSGWYFRVLRPGALEVGMELPRVQHPRPEWTVCRADEVWERRLREPGPARAMGELPEVGSRWRAGLHAALGMSDYRPLACGLHDLLEHAAVRGEPVEVDLQAEPVSQLRGRVTALPTSDGAEYVELDRSRWIRLDRLVDVRLAQG